jgi:AcrR family transcriptional regulator
MRRTATVPRKQATQDRAHATVDALVAATARLLVREGYDRTSTNKIAEAAGVSIGSLYQYFPSKEALVAAVIERHVDQMNTLFRDALTRIVHAPVERAAREIVQLMIEAHRIQPKLHRVLAEQIPRVGRLEYVERVDVEACQLVRAYLEAHADEIRDVDLDLAAFLSVGCVEAMTHIAVLRRPELLEDPRFVDELVTMVVRYLAPSPYARRTE